MSTLPRISWLSDIDTETEKIGKHIKHLAKLTQAKFPMLPGFVITSKAYTDFLWENRLDYKITQLLSTVAMHRPESLMQIVTHIQKLFFEAKLSPQLKQELSHYFEKLNGEVTLLLFETGNHGRKHKTVDVSELEELFEKVKDIWAEMFSGYALWNRHQHQADHIETGAEIVILKQVTGEKKGTVFTLNPATHEKDKLIIITNHPYEGDGYVLSKKNLTIIDRLFKQQGPFKLTLDEIMTVARTAKKLEEHLYFPQEISWAIDGSKLYITDVKPITTLPQKQAVKQTPRPLARGKGITGLVATGIIKRVNSSKDLQKIKKHDVVVIDQIQIANLKQLKKARAVIVKTHPSHTLTILLRHHGIPVVFHSEFPSYVRNGHIITVHSGKGELYRGGLL